MYCKGQQSHRIQYPFAAHSHTGYPPESLTCETSALASSTPLLSCYVCDLVKKYLLTFGKHSSLYPEAEQKVGEVVEVVLGWFGFESSVNHETPLEDENDLKLAGN